MKIDINLKFPPKITKRNYDQVNGRIITANLIFSYLSQILQ